MEYLAHIENEREQTIKDHLKGTAKLASEFADQFGGSNWGYCCGMLHDIGKYSEKFQRKIHQDPDIQVDHATAGAQLCYNMGGLYAFISYCIAGHHAGLPDYGSNADVGSDSTLKGRMRKKIEDYQAYKKEIEVPELNSVPFDFERMKQPGFSLSVFIRMLYSCLVDADFLDTERFMKNGQTGRECGESMTSLLDKLQLYISAWLANEALDTVNGRRTEILKHCLQCGTMPKGIFRLTVPTGGGKTVASLAFALRHAVWNHMDRIIYVIPYTSIIEQNAKVFREILGDINVLENHYNVDYESSEEFKPMQLAAENWDKPVIVTTNVQFFESLYANKSSKCRKLHNIANSVVVFDEAQMLPLDYLKPCVAMMEELVNHYGVSIVLCTATQPALNRFFQDEMTITELCPRKEEQFRFFERTCFKNIGTVTEEDLISRLKDESQTLCILNTKRRAQAIYQKLKGQGVYHLSTTMYPKHRSRVLKEIKERLIGKKKCIVISTSLVEAGVDLDFKTVYRQLAGADSMIQAAGRCNREGSRSVEESVVSIFKFEENENIPGQRQQIDISKTMLAEGKDIFSFQGVEAYFQALYHYRGKSLDKKKIMDEFATAQFNFAKVGKTFKLIEENTKTIFIPKEAEAICLLNQIRNQGYTKANMRRAAQYSIQVYDNDLQNMYDAGMLKLVSEDMTDFYELMDAEQYTNDMGLKLNIQPGMALFA